MSKKIHTEAVDHLFEAVLCLENKEECYTSVSYTHLLTRTVIR